MKGLVAYYTKYGNGKIISEAIARGLEESGNEMTVVSLPVKDVSGDYDFVVVSSPTRFGKMLGPVKKFIRKNLGGAAWRGKPFVAVGTGLRPAGEDGAPQETDESGGPCGPAESAEQVYSELESAGLKPAAPPQKFFVSGMKGPLWEGEPERALGLGREVGRELAGGS